MQYNSTFRACRWHSRSATVFFSSPFSAQVQSLLFWNEPAEHPHYRPVWNWRLFNLKITPTLKDTIQNCLNGPRFETDFDRGIPFRFDDSNTRAKTWADPEGDRGSGPHPLWKITSGYRFPQKCWYGPSSRSSWPLGPNCFSREVRTAFCERHWWSLKKSPPRPWWNYLDPPIQVLYIGHSVEKMILLEASKGTEK